MLCSSWKGALQKERLSRSIGRERGGGYCDEGNRQGRFGYCKEGEVEEESGGYFKEEEEVEEERGVL